MKFVGDTKGDKKNLFPLRTFEKYLTNASDPEPDGIEFVNAILTEIEMGVILFDFLQYHQFVLWKKGPNFMHDKFE